MLLTTTNIIEGHPVRQYLGLVTGEVIIGANALKDLSASITDFFGGRTTSYESTMIEARETALREMQDRAVHMGANAIIGIDYDYETLGANNSILMVAVTGTAVVV